MKQQRYLIRATGADPRDTLLGLRTVVRNLGANEEAVIVVPSFNHLKDTALGQVLGKENARTLIKERRLSWENGAAISLCSMATLKNFKRRAHYLVLWCSKDPIKTIEADGGWKSLTWVTWNPNEADFWEELYAVQVIPLDDGS